jgi:hypothetical protein
MKTKEIIIAILMFMFIAFGFGYFLGKGLINPKIPIPGQTITKYDTIIKPGETIKIKGKGIITYTTKYDTIIVKDTIYASRAFVSVLDTIHQKDTIHVAYFFPLDIHYITIKKGQDSIINKIVTIYQPVEKKDPWYQLPLTIFGSAAAGFLIGKALK